LNVVQDAASECEGTSRFAAARPHLLAGEELGYVVDVLHELRDFQGEMFAVVSH
jgi:hypothetical protein